MSSAKQKGSATAAIGWLRILRGYLFFACLGIWVARWLLFIVGLIRIEGTYFYRVLRSSPESVRAFHASYDPTSRDFYRILAVCDQMLPLGAELQLVLPAEPRSKFEFLSGKARYFLYPRNYGDNVTRKTYILVYQVKDFYPPAGYEIFVMFAPDKYLLVNRTL